MDYFVFIKNSILYRHQTILLKGALNVPFPVIHCFTDECLQSLKKTAFQSFTFKMIAFFKHFFKTKMV